jgi:hypothetical protein
MLFRFPYRQKVMILKSVVDPAKLGIHLRGGGGTITLKGLGCLPLGCSEGTCPAEAAHVSRVTSGDEGNVTIGGCAG